MTDWKTAGRAPREVEDSLWQQFKAAQDTFFRPATRQFAAQDEEFRGNQTVKEQILVEAEQIDPEQGLEKARARLKVLQDRWEAAGKVPRDVMRSLEDRMAAVEDKVRAAGIGRAEARREHLHGQAARAGRRARGEAGQGAGRGPPDRRPREPARHPARVADGRRRRGEPRRRRGGGGRKKPTTAWVRADG